MTIDSSDRSETAMALREDFAIILEHYEEARRRRDPQLEDQLVESFEGIRARLQDRFGVRARARYEVQVNTGYLEGSSNLPMIDFHPKGEGAHERNPQLHCMIVFPPDQRKLYLLLTDIRREKTSDGQKRRETQLEQVRVLLQRETDLAWRFESAKPAIFRRPPAQVESPVRSRFAEGAVFFRAYDAELLPQDDKILEELDAVLRLREIYVEKFRSRNLDELVETGDQSPPATIAAIEGLDQESEAAMPGEVPVAQNILLYGPPGTGKTYSTIRRSLELCRAIEPDEALSDTELRAKFQRLRDEGRIEFVTFHQSYGYEEFVEGIRPVLDSTAEESDSSGSGDVRYQCELGIFKRISLLAASEGLRLTQDDQQFEARWLGLRRKVEEEGDFRATSMSGYGYRLQIVDTDEFRLVRDDGDDPSPTQYTVHKHTAKRWWNKRHELGTDYKRLNSDRVGRIVARKGNFTPNWIVYRLLSELDEEEIATANAAAESADVDQQERISKAATYLQERSSRAFNRFDQARHYVLIIDEINRGNISKILGELITLLEPDKRLRASDELVVRLPYSKQAFAVPPNLHILGTMNTADRSIALMDTALRRRFSFEEMMPDANVILKKMADNLGGGTYEQVDDDEARYLINLVLALFDTLNDRISFLYDRDHQIGHSYLMNVTGLEQLRVAFVDKIIPLLQEYFYGSWNRLCLVLGSPYDERGLPQRTRSDKHAFANKQHYEAPMIEVRALDEQEVLRTSHEDYEGKLDYNLHPGFARTSNPDDADRLAAFFEAVLSQDVRKEVRALTYVDRYRGESA